jgi:hypothetical protein
MGPDRSTQPVLTSVWHPFDLDDPQAIYNPHARSHASIHLSSATEEQRREGHHSEEERVEMVD